MKTTKISLICATYNRSTELEQLLKSLVTQTYKNFEIIIVDQNKNGLIDGICQSYKQQLNLIHIKSEKLGLSFNRNIGIKAAIGEILAFPDDDCSYYPDTLEKVSQLFNQNKADLILGQIRDRISNKPIIRNWPKSATEITKIRKILGLVTSITIFCRKNPEISFDELFGVGSKFGAYEDSDLCTQYLNLDKKLLYTPSIEVLHPEGDTILNKSKAYNYGRGWGAFFAKHIDFRTLPLLIGIFGYVSLLFLRDVILLRPTAKNRLYSLTGRINGFIDYLIHHKFKCNDKE